MGSRQPIVAYDEMAGVERVNTADRTRTITGVDVGKPATLRVRWSDGTRAELDLSGIIRGRGFRTLRDPKEFARVRIGEWGHGVEWTSGPQLSAETLWLETLSATGRSDARVFLEWRLKHGLSLSGAAEALGLSRRMVAYYSNGEKKVPRAILLACRGWEAEVAA
jgi:hypothetical protein